VVDHPLTTVSWPTTALNHVFRGFPRRRCSLELTRRNRLLHKRLHEIRITQLRIRHLFADTYVPRRIPIDLVRESMDEIVGNILEWLTGFVFEWDSFVKVLTSQFYRQPPLLRPQSRWWSEMLQNIPMRILASNQH